MTPIDAAHSAMEADPQSATLRLRFFERLAECELFVLLEKEATESQITPMVFPVDGTDFVLAFDLEDRLAEFAGATVPFVAVSGRNLANMLAAERLGLGLNLDVAPSSILIPPDAISWLNGTLSQKPSEDEATPSEFNAPSDLPEALLTALDSKLASAAGLAKFAYLAGVTYQSGALGHLLAFIDPLPGAEPALAAAVNEALVFSGVEAGQLDVCFFSASDPSAGKLARVGLRFDLPQPESNDAMLRPAPGSDPDKPPKLR